MASTPARAMGVLSTQLPGLRAACSHLHPLTAVFWRRCHRADEGFAVDDSATAARALSMLSPCKAAAELERRYSKRLPSRHSARSTVLRDSPRSRATATDRLKQLPLANGANQFRAYHPNSSPQPLKAVGVLVIRFGGRFHPEPGRHCAAVYSIVRQYTFLSWDPRHRLTPGVYVRA
jgi:hypothetical protein